MAAYVDQAYYGWSHEELPDHNESQGVSVSQMLDHGSISFGRFALESLSWEKRSVFTYNKREEELEKFKSPGLVAQKKAYFEEYYKKIRAMKALQENQQTELTLDYGGDGSISSQNGEEDETTVQVVENLGDGAPHVIDAHVEEASTENSKEKDCSEALQIQIRHSDRETALPNLDSPMNNLEEIQQDMNSACALQMLHLDRESTVDKTLVRSIEDNEQHDLNDLVERGVSSKHNNSLPIVESESVSQASALHPTNSKLEDLEAKPAQNISAVKKSKDCVSVPKVKEPSTPVRNVLKSESKTRSGMVKSLRSPKYPSQKTIVKAKKNVAADDGSQNYKSASIASHRPLTEVHSNVTIPRPFSFATERRATVPSGTREGMLQSNSKTSNKLSPLSVHGKDAKTMQGTPKRIIITNGVRSRGSENKRSHEERKKPLAADSHSTCIKGGGTNLLRPPKARSINLPAHSKSCSNGGTEKKDRDAVREEIQQEGITLGETQRAGTKISAPHQAGNVKTETKQVVPPCSNLSLNGRKPRFGEQSVDGKKPRQEKPRWR